VSEANRNGSKGAFDVPGLEEDADASRVVGEELRLLAMVESALVDAANATVTAARVQTQDDARLLELRDDVSTAKPEDLPALFEQMHHLSAIRAHRGKSAAGIIDRSSPYFGHLRLEENGKRRDVLVGARSYVDSAAGVRIVDWRHAPVSRIFYRYIEEEEYEEELGGRTVEGIVLARRSVAIVKGELKRVAAPQGTFILGADARWRRVATNASRLVTEKRWPGATSANAVNAPGEAPRLGIGVDGNLREDKMLPSIAAMLDPAQYELITRMPSSGGGSGLVAIQGSAGSGKTTVGLHRVAYLAFTDPARFRPDRMMVVVPHDALVHYVGRVLPSLGVEGVPVTTFARWSTRIVSALFPKMPYATSDETPPVVSRAKAHAAMLRAIDLATSDLVKTLDARVVTAMEKWPEGARVIEAWAKTATRVASGAEMAPDVRVTALAFWTNGKRAIAGAGNAADLPEVTKHALEKLGHELRRESRAAVSLWDEILTNRDRLTRAFEGENGFGPGQLDQLHAWCIRQARVRSEGERDGEHATIDAEDRALLLRVFQSLRGPLEDGEGKPMRLAHVFIDEVQDASPVEMRVLLDLVGQDQSITLAGDTAQRMFENDEDRGEFDWEKLLIDLEIPHAKIEPLQVSYRSTAEITSFARAVLGQYAHDAEPIANRHGPGVEVFSFGSPGESVAFLADALKRLAREEPYANVALVARFGPHADMYFEGLQRAEVPNVRRVAKQDFTWEPGFDVTDVRQTKGLEFDEVVLLETTASSYGDNAIARHTMYVGATRAAHQLWCVASEKVSPIVEDALRETALPPQTDATNTH
jgi:DNA helicase-2/ATP-dependent DNA helicase PcrA